MSDANLDKKLKAANIINAFFVKKQTYLISSNIKSQESIWKTISTSIHMKAISLMNF